MKAILVDVTKCTGCEKCVTACIEANKLNPEKAELDRLTSRDGLSDNRFLSLVQVAEGRFARKSCMHCVEPSCVSACLVGGMTKSPDGPVIYDPDKCIGCRYCMLACPFHIPRYEWDSTTPLVRKCTMCFERLENGQQPACVAACPNQALVFGERQSLLTQAKKHISRKPDTYIQHIWGEHEFGGTSVMYISDVDLTTLGWPEQDHPPIPSLTEPLVHKTPFIGLTVAAGLLGINWIVRRRMIRAEEKQAENQTHQQDKGKDPEGWKANDD